MSTKRLRRLAQGGYWDERKINAMKRKKLIRLLSTPHWKNEHEKANVRIFASLPPSMRRFSRGRIVTWPTSPTQRRTI